MDNNKYKRRMANMTDEQMSRHREQQAARQRRRRARLDDQQMLEHRIRNARAQRDRRARLNDDQLLELRLRNARSQRDRRARLDDQQLMELRKRDARAQKRRRSRLSEDQLSEYRARNARAHRLKYAVDKMVRHIFDSSKAVNLTGECVDNIEANDANFDAIRSIAEPICDLKEVTEPRIEKRFECHECGAITCTPESLYRHIRENHLTDHCLNCVAHHHCCNCCHTQTVRRTHQTSYHSNPSFACVWPQCKTKFKTNNQLVQHMRTHKTNHNNNSCDLRNNDNIVNNICPEFNPNVVNGMHSFDSELAANYPNFNYYSAVTDKSRTETEPSNTFKPETDGKPIDNR